MTLISLAITVAFAYSLASLVLPDMTSFFWELVTLIDVMLLGHWMEMRSIRRASGALQELAKLMPDTAERITEDGTEEVQVDGVVEEGESSLDESMITGEARPVKKEPGDEVVGGTITAAAAYGYA